MPGHAGTATGADIVCQGPGEDQVLGIIREVLGDKITGPGLTGGFGSGLKPSYELLRNRESLPFQTSRGCPYRCAFCAAPVLFEGHIQRPPDSVVEDVVFAVSELGTEHIAFYDDALLVNKENHIVPFLKTIGQKKLPVAFHTPNGLHVREIDTRLAVLMKRANFRSLFLSQESVDERVLEKSCSKTTRRDLERALLSLKEAGFDAAKINVYLMVGLPGQDVQGINDSIRSVRELGARPRLSYFSPVPGTREWKAVIELGLLSEDSDPLLHNKLLFPYLGGNISPEQIGELKALASD
jgi:radical SAM superfamily enzyme YgiQ (UPF0313 family)